MSRRKFAEERKRVNVYIKKSILDKFTFANFNPARGRADYGALSGIVNELLEKHLEETLKDEKG